MSKAYTTNVNPMPSKQKPHADKLKGWFYGTIEELRQKILAENDMDGELLLTPGLSHSSSSTLRNTLRDMEKMITSKYHFFRIEAFCCPPVRKGGKDRYTLTQPAKSNEASRMVWINESLISQWFPQYQDRQVLCEIASLCEKEQKEHIDHINRVERKKNAFREILQKLQTKNEYRPEKRQLDIIQDEEKFLADRQRLYVQLLTTFTIASKEMESVLAKLSSDASVESKTKALRNFSLASTRWPSFSAADCATDDWNGEYNLSAVSSSMAYNLETAAVTESRLAAQRKELVKIQKEKAQLLETLKNKSIEQIVEDYGQRVSNELLLTSKKKKYKKG